MQKYRIQFLIYNLLIQVFNQNINKLIIKDPNHVVNIKIM